MLQSSSLMLLLALNLVITLRVLVGRKEDTTEWIIGRPQYSYIGNDYPSRYDTPFSTVELTFEESTHYDVDTPDAMCEWIAIRDINRGQGQVRVGPDHRAFGVAMLHQLHCMNIIRIGIVDRDHPSGGAVHVQHCLNYMRQLLLCAADTTLEPGDFMGRDYVKERVGPTKGCRDWGAVYKNIAENYDSWLAYSDTHGNISGSSDADTRDAWRRMCGLPKD